MYLKSPGGHREETKSHMHLEAPGEELNGLLE